MLDYCKPSENAVVIGGGLSDWNRLSTEAAGMNVTVLHLMDRIMDRRTGYESQSNAEKIN